MKKRLMDDLKIAMREKQVNRKNTIQMTRAAILQIEKDNKIELSDNEVLEIIAKEVKKRKDALKDFEKAGREDIIAQTLEEIAVLNEYLPKQLSKEELTEIIKTIIQEENATTMKNMGIVMKKTKEKVGTSSDGRSINEIVKDLLS